MNSLFVINPYRYQGMWVFDDECVGLHREPFVSGADTMIDVVTQNIPDAENGFRMIFAATPFPGFMVHLQRRREEFGGNWYYSAELDKEGWLCPALFKYFETAPQDLYVRIEAVGNESEAK